jgi:hypothetical protein
MKKQVSMIVTLIALIVAVGLSSAMAQNSGGKILQVDIPFAFNVGEKTLPAGEYTVDCVNNASDLKILKLRNKTVGSNVLVQTGSVIGKTHEKATLVFYRYGERYFFWQAWLVGDNIGMQAPKSRGERAIAKELALIKHATETVTLTMKR